ncbi:MAG: competence type IV pilus major pilin ComGC [Enterococcus sp.]
MKKMQQWWKKGFTLIEMLIVLLVIGVLILLFVPNLSKHKDVADDHGNDAIVQVVETQMELYMLDEDTTEKPTPQTLEGAGYITAKQLTKYLAVTGN